MEVYREPQPTGRALASHEGFLEEQKPERDSKTGRGWPGEEQRRVGHCSRQRQEILDSIIYPGPNHCDSVSLYSVLPEYKILGILISRWKKRGWVAWARV